MLRDSNIYAHLQNLIPHVTLESEKSGTRVVHSHELQTVLELKDRRFANPMRRASAALLCLSLGSEVNAINLIGFPNTAQRPGWVSLSATPAAHSPGAERWQRGLPCPPRCPGDITALVKQKRNPTGGSCSLKKYQCSQAPWGEYISL